MSLILRQPILKVTRPIGVQTATRFSLGLSQSNSRSSFSTLNRVVLQQQGATDSSNTTSNTGKDSKEKKPRINLYDTIKRGTKFTFSTVLVAGAISLASVSLYLLFSELFSPSGETQTFNRVVSMIEKDEKSLLLLGYSEEEIKAHDGKIRLKAYGENVTGDRWTRNRPVSSNKFTGKDGKEHLLMRFHVENTNNNKIGTVQLEAIDENFIKQDLIYILLDVKGEKRHYVFGGPKYKKSMRFTNPASFPGFKFGSSK